MKKKLMDRIELMKLKGNGKGGFTLIELVVVIAIMAVLALIMVPNLTAYIQKANVAKIQANMKNIHTASEMVLQTEETFDVTKVSEFSNLTVVDTAAEDVYSVDVSAGNAVVTFGTVDDGFRFDGKEFVELPVVELP